MYVATMATTHFDFVALGETKVAAAEAMAAGFDKHLDLHGDENRERFLYSSDAIDGDDGDPLGDTDMSVTFGSDLNAFARVLNDYYGITVFSLEPGEAAEEAAGEGAFA